MESLFILIPLSVLAVGVAVGVFFWMNHDGQFEDDQGPAWSILLDDDRAPTSEDSDAASADVTIEKAEGRNGETADCKGGDTSRDS